MKDIIVKVQDMSFEYQDRFKAISGINLEILQGEKVGLIGANGAGKSTLLKLLVGLYFAKSGSVEIDKIKVDKKNLKDIRKLIGFVFQDSNNQIFMNKVYDDVAFGLRNNNVSEKEINEKVDRVLKEDLIYDLKDKNTYKLSAGQRRSVAISGILVMKPKLIIMDEPTSDLDPKSRRRLINKVNKLTETIIIATHDLDMILDCTDRVVILKDGKIVADGSSEEILKNKELLESCDLELPLSQTNKYY